MALSAYLTKNRIEAGCDEAGRGSLAGPVVASAVILSPGTRLPGLNDSKKLTAEIRRELRLQIEKKSVSWAVSFVFPDVIDKINILKASILAMHQAVSQLQCTPEHLLIDGNQFQSFPHIGHTCVIKGDGRYRAIAAASILAKTHRDDYMEWVHKECPEYGWAENKGYPTEMHRIAITRIGTHPFHHRKTFRCTTSFSEDVQ